MQKLGTPGGVKWGQTTYRRHSKTWSVPVSFPNSHLDTTLVAGKISAGNEAYVYAGNELNLLAAQSKGHTLYDKKE